MLDSSPLVSVVINTYNHSDFISRAIESALQQKTAFPFEIIIGEDESNDGTREICVDYANRYPERIRLFLRSRKDVIFINNKPTGRFNFIQNITNAKGKYVALLPGDDYWTDENKLQKQVDILEANSECIACHHWHKVASPDESGLFVEQAAPKNGHGYFPRRISSVREIFANKMRVKSRAIMFRNLFRDGFSFPDWFMHVQFGDVALSMILGQFGDFYFIDEEMAVYRLTGSGVSTLGNGSPDFVMKHFKEWIRIWEMGDRWNSGKYRQEVLSTIMHFYGVILKHYKFSRQVKKDLRKDALANSALPYVSRIKLAWKIVMAADRDTAS